MADGSRSMHPTIVVYKVTLGDRRIQNVKAVVNSDNAGMTLISFPVLNRFGKFTVDTAHHRMVFGS